jgi:hypothetical protein
MPEKTEVTIAFENERLSKLNEAKQQFETDTKNPVELSEFVDMLVEAFLAYRKLRGASESSMLQKLPKNESAGN